MMQTRRDRSRKRYQTALPSSVPILKYRAQELRPIDPKTTAQVNNSHSPFQTATSGRRLSPTEKQPTHDQDGVRLASDEEQAARITDALLPYERLVPANNFARILAAELGLLDEDGQTTRGQNSSETDRPRTSSSKSSGPDQQPSKANGSADSAFGRLTESPPTSDSSGMSPISPRKERSVPLQIGSGLKTRSRPRSRGRKVLSVINEPESPVNSDATSVRSMSGPSCNLPSDVGLSTRRRAGSTSSPRAQMPKLSLRNLDELRSLIPSPLPVRSSQNPTMVERISSPISRPRTSEAPEFECVEGVTLDTLPVDAKEKFSGLSLPEIEARDIRDIED